ncbi:MAG: hypothetical protein Q8N98_05400 [bacterium]|nr:hypothetical protein [bacterium]
MSREKIPGGEEKIDKGKPKEEPLTDREAILDSFNKAEEDTEDDVEIEKKEEKTKISPENSSESPKPKEKQRPKVQGGDLLLSGGRAKIETETPLNIPEKSALEKKIEILEVNLDSFLKYNISELKNILNDVSLLLKEVEEQKAKEELQNRIRKVFHKLSMQYNDLIEKQKEEPQADKELSVEELLSTAKNYISNLKLDKLGLDELKKELFKIADLENAADQAIFDCPQEDESCQKLHQEIYNLKDLYDKIQERMAGLKEEPKPQEGVPQWENLVDQWIESKIQREMEKQKIGRQEAENNIKDKFKRVFLHTFRDFAVHKTLRSVDLDSRVCLGLINYAGWNEKGYTYKKLDGEIKYRKHEEKLAHHIHPNERRGNMVHMDVGQYDGVTFLQNTEEGLKELEFSDKKSLEKRKEEKGGLGSFFRNLGVIVDHHPDGAPSASIVLARLLDKLGMFDDNPNVEKGDFYKIKKMIDFVDLLDSHGFQEVGGRENWEKADRTVLGLNRYMQFDKLLEFFRNDGDYNRQLTDEELKKYGLIYDEKDEKTGKIEHINRQKQQRKVIDVSKEKLEKLKKEEAIIDTKFGKIIVDAKGELPGGAFAAQSIDSGYLKWEAPNKTLFMFSDKELDKDLFEKGIRIRKHLWLIPEDTKETGLTLNKVLEKIGGKVIQGSGLDRYLKEEERGKTTKKEQPQEKPEEKKFGGAFEGLTIGEKIADKIGLAEIEGKIKQKEAELEQAEQKMAIYRPIGWFQRKPVVRDLGYNATDADLKKIKAELKDLQTAGHPVSLAGRPQGERIGKNKIGFWKRLFSRTPERKLTDEEILKSVNKDPKFRKSMRKRYRTKYKE